MKKTRRILSILAVAALLTGVLPASVSAAEPAFTPEVSKTEVGLELCALRQEAGKVTVSGAEDCVRISADCRVSDLIHTEDAEKKIGLVMTGIQEFPEKTESVFTAAEPEQEEGEAQENGAPCIFDMENSAEENEGRGMAMFAAASAKDLENAVPGTYEAKVIYTFRAYDADGNVTEKTAEQTLSLTVPDDEDVFAVRTVVKTLGMDGEETEKTGGGAALSSIFVKEDDEVTVTVEPAAHFALEKITYGDDADITEAKAFSAKKDVTQVEVVFQQTEEDEETSGEDEETPGEDEETPGEDDEIPGEGEETPGEDDETPGEDEETPGEDDETPGEGEDEKEEDGASDGTDGSGNADGQDAKDKDAKENDAKDKDQKEADPVKEAEAEAAANSEKEAGKAKKAVYSIGTSGPWEKGSGNSFTVVVVREPDNDKCFSHFASVDIDGKALIKDTEYTAKSGSTVLTIKAEVMEKLSMGKHVISVNFDDGKAEAELMVDSRLIKPTSVVKPSNAAKTGDGSGALLWGLAAAVSAGVILVLARRRRKAV